MELYCTVIKSNMTYIINVTTKGITSVKNINKGGMEWL